LFSVTTTTFYTFIEIKRMSKKKNTTGGKGYKNSNKASKGKEKASMDSRQQEMYSRFIAQYIYILIMSHNFKEQNRN